MICLFVQIIRRRGTNIYWICKCQALTVSYMTPGPALWGQRDKETEGVRVTSWGHSRSGLPENLSFPQHSLFPWPNSRLTGELRTSHKPWMRLLTWRFGTWCHLSLPALHRWGHCALSRVPDTSYRFPGDRGETQKQLLVRRHHTIFCSTIRNAEQASCGLSFFWRWLSPSAGIFLKTALKRKDKNREKKAWGKICSP